MPFRSLALPALWKAAVLAAAVSAGSGVWWWHDLTRDLPGDTAIRHIGDTAQSTIIFDASDAPASTLSTEERIDVPLSEVSPDFIRALIAIEDQRFYSHGAVDPPRIAKAAFANITRRRAAQGASTLTQQLAKNLYLGDQRTLTRKAEEALLAVRLERALSKRRIFELYLNEIEWGDGIYGAEAAARRHFGVSAAELSPRQAVLLAAVIINPRRYSVLGPSRRIEKRARMIASRMRRRGLLTEDQYLAATGGAPPGPTFLERLFGARPETTAAVADSAREGRLEPSPAALDSSSAPAADTAVSPGPGPP